MSGILIEGGDVEVDASVIARGLEIAPESVRSQMREGQLTGRLERGVDEDAGTYRLTFTHGRRQLQLVVDESGRVLNQTINDVGRRGRRRRRNWGGLPQSP